jgi:hypothetical protein
MAFLACVAVPEEAAQSDPEASVQAELEELCQSVLCRDPVPIQLKLPDGDLFEMTPTLPTPIAAGGLVTVYPGETVMIEATVEGTRLVDLTAVPEVRQPERTLVLRLRQEPSIDDGTGMILELESPFAGVLKFRLGMMLPSSGDLFKTSSCPLHAERPLIEAWPHPIFQIVATDFHFVDPESKSATTCE